MENTISNSVEIIINNPANTLSQPSIDLLRTIAKQSDLNKIKADRFDKELNIIHRHLGIIENEITNIFNDPVKLQIEKCLKEISEI